jgi:hypothetical protein
MKKISASVLAALLSLAIAPADAFDFGKLPIGGGKDAGAGSGASANDVAKNTRDAMIAFADAKLGLLDALGGYENLSADRKLAEGQQKGDAGVSTDQIKTLVSLDKTATAALNERLASNTQLDAAQKKKAAQSVLVYVKALDSTRKSLLSLQGVARNPLALGSNAGPILLAVKEMPGLVSGGVSTTGALFQYMGANGVDMKEAKSVAASSMEK